MFKVTDDTDGLFTSWVSSYMRTRNIIPWMWLEKEWKMKGNLYIDMLYVLKFIGNMFSACQRPVNYFGNGESWMGIIS